MKQLTDQRVHPERIQGKITDITMPLYFHIIDDDNVVSVKRKNETTVTLHCRSKCGHVTFDLSDRDRQMIINIIASL